MDCGKPLTASAMAVASPAGGGGGGGGMAPAPVPATRVYPPSAPGPAGAVPLAGAGPKCSNCGKAVDAALPFCAFCGAKLEPAMASSPPPPPPPSPAPAAPPHPPCPKCGTRIANAGYKFCPNCATPLGAAPGARVSSPHEATALFSGIKKATTPVTLVIVKEDGSKGTRHGLVGEETTIGRAGADITFTDDTYLSPIHALLLWKDSKLVIRDLGSRNGTWIFQTGPHKLVDGDLILIGSQLIRFRRLGYPGPHPPEADATRRMGSLIPSADIASLAQLRADGSVRDTFHLSPGRDVMLGRDKGDWSFPYDPSMSGTHAQVRSEDADFVLLDAGSRNGIAVAARGDVTLAKGSKLLVGDKLMMVEIA
jgi:pSer/pThr/pTyr-binding forkhead associated (FHA) protein